MALALRIKDDTAKLLNQSKMICMQLFPNDRISNEFTIKKVLEAFIKRNWKKANVLNPDHDERNNEQPAGGNESTPAEDRTGEPIEPDVRPDDS